jgi:hypothetical protein
VGTDKDWSLPYGAPNYPPNPACVGGANWKDAIPWWQGDVSWPIGCGSEFALRVDPDAGDGWVVVVASTPYSTTMTLETFALEGPSPSEGNLEKYDLELKITRQCDGDLRVEALLHASASTMTLWLGEPGNGGQPIEPLDNMCSQGWVYFHHNIHNYPGACENLLPQFAIIPGMVTGDFPCEP